MICDKCGTDGTLNWANGKEFYFCSTCRDEIMPQPVSNLTPEQEEEFHKWVEEFNNVASDEDLEEMFKNSTDSADAFYKRLGIP